MPPVLRGVAYMENNEFKYGCVFRPPAPGAVPNMSFKLEPSLPDTDARRFYTRHGVIVFSRQLTSAELVAYELAVIADDHLKAEIVGLVVAEMSDYAEGYLALADTDADEFARAVMKAAKDATPYLAYLGPSAEFVASVAGRLRA